MARKFGLARAPGSGGRGRAKPKGAIFGGQVAARDGGARSGPSFPESV